MSPGGGKASLLVWREPDPGATAFTCGEPPPGQPSSHGELLAFNEEEEVVVLTGPFFSRASSRVDVGATGLGIPYARGFLQLDLDELTEAGGPPGDGRFRQAFVMSVRHDAAAGTGWVQNGHPLPRPPEVSASWSRGRRGPSCT